MVEFIVFCLPGLVYVLVQSRGEHRSHASPTGAPASAPSRQ
ncbi:hypothetical protein [Pseudoclavibacter terrae]|nr:hypothetical protein [Pseudoclavibacter terrae]